MQVSAFCLIRTTLPRDGATEARSSSPADGYRPQRPATAPAADAGERDLGSIYAYCIAHKPCTSIPQAGRIRGIGNERTSRAALRNEAAGPTGGAAITICRA